MMVFFALLYRLQDNYFWLLGLLFMIEPALDCCVQSYREWADKYVSRKLRTRLSIGVSIAAAFIACFLAFPDQCDATIQANNEKNTTIGERVEARRQLTEKVVPPPRQPTSPEVVKYICATAISAQTPDHSAILFEFGIRGGSSNGFAGLVAIDQPISKALSWLGAPLRTDISPNTAALYTISKDQITGESYRRSFASPQLTPQKSEYIYIEAEKSFNLRAVAFLEDFDALQDQIKANNAVLFLADFDALFLWRLRHNIATTGHPSLGVTQDLNCRQVPMLKNSTEP
jgi:hypothetical protein